MGLIAKFDLSKYRRCNIKEFGLREVTGLDEEQAALSAKAKGGAASVREELVRLSITEYDGKKVTPEDPVPFDSWNTRTRTFVASAFDQLNGISSDEGQSFLAQGRLASEG